MSSIGHAYIGHAYSQAHRHAFFTSHSATIVPVASIRTKIHNHKVVTVRGGAAGGGCQPLVWFELPDVNENMVLSTLKSVFFC